MSTLYELRTDFECLYAQLDALDPEDECYNEMCQAWMDTLEGLEGEINQKAENIAVYIKRLASDAAAMDAEEKAMKARRKACENRAERLREYLLNQMQEIGITKFSSPRARITVTQGRESICITDADSILYDGGEFVKPRRLKEDDLDKTRIKEAILSGRSVPGATLVRKPGLLIK